MTRKPIEVKPFNNEEFGRRLFNTRRCFAKINVYQLSERSGTAPENIWRWEAGRGCPTVDSLFKLANGLGVPVSHLLGEDYIGVS